MNKLLKSALLAALMLPALSAAADEPAITLRTNIYDTAGPSNTCTITIGGTEGAYVMVDCGFGAVEYQIKNATFDSSTQTINGTPISCQVSKEGIIKVYPDPGVVIDYFNAEGCGLEWVKFADPSKLQIVNFCHNSLQELDLSDFADLQIAYLSDNPFDRKPLTIGKNHPDLAMLEINAVYNLEKDFDINTYPKLTIFDAFAVPGLTKLTPAGCPGLVRLSIDCTNVKELDLSNNPNLAILNISETGITEIDLSHNTNLQQLYCVHASDTYNPDVKLKSLDVSMLPNLVYLFATGNDLTSIDVSKNTKLDHLWLGNNQLSELNIDNCPLITSLHIEDNNFDFVSLPADREDFIEYEYAQKPWPVPAELEIGKPLDLSARIARPGTETYACLVSVKRSAPYSPVEVDESKYTFADGKLTVNSAIADSVYLQLVNSDFTLYSLNTARFKVKSAAEMGQPDLQMTFQPGTAEGQPLSMCIGIEGASPQSPKKLYVKQGSGDTAEFSITTSAMPAEPNVTVTAVGWGQTQLLTDVNEKMSAVGIDGVAMYACDVTPMSSLRNLRLTGSGLYELDLSYNRCLESLVVTGNHFSKFSLDGISGDFMKNLLTYVDVSNNEITEFEVSIRSGLKHLDLHGNRLAAMDFSDADNIEYLDVSHNQLSELKLNYQGKLTELNASYNNIASYMAPETNVIEKADFSNNAFTFATLPARGSIEPANFKYAPQAKIQISAKAPGVDLGTQNVEIEGQPVVFAWRKADGSLLTEGVDYTLTEGRTRFLAPAVGSTVYCTMTCAALPDFAGENALKTSEVLASEMPSNVVASFTTATAATMSLSLGAHTNGTAIYIDWNGDGTDLVEYLLNDSYTLFSATTKPGAPVKVLSYETDNDVRVFSISGAPLSNFDGTGLNRAMAITVADAGLSEIKLPEGSQIEELSLSGNALEQFDASKYPGLRTLSLSDNKLATLDLSPCKGLQVFAGARNKLTGVKFAADNKIYFLDLTDNELESYDLQVHPELNQCGLAGNHLTQINAEGLQWLRTLALDYNNFTFATLPLPRDEWVRYTYANQADIVPVINGLVVDLSSQKEVSGEPTAYRWFIGEPTYDAETGELVGEELVAGEEYTIEDGVTTLAQGFRQMICVMTNSLLPNLTLYTPMLDLSGIEAIGSDAADAAAIYYTPAGVRVANPGPGLYIVVRGNKVTKEYLK